MANNSFQSNYGKIGRLYPDAHRLYFKFKDGQSAMINPQTQYYFISADLQNYEALARLVYLCAEKGWTLHAETKPTLTGGKPKWCISSWTCRGERHHQQG